MIAEFENEEKWEEVKSSQLCGSSNFGLTG
jgi:hypothetical protein